MSNILMMFLTGLVALAIGFFVGRALLKKTFQSKDADAEIRAKEVLKNAQQSAENIKKDKLLSKRIKKNTRFMD